MVTDQQMMPGFQEWDNQKNAASPSWHEETKKGKPVSGDSVGVTLDLRHCSHTHTLGISGQWWATAWNAGEDRPQTAMSRSHADCGGEVEDPGADRTVSWLCHNRRGETNTGEGSGEAETGSGVSLGTLSVGVHCLSSDREKPLRFSV